jgi:enamine deaminase RidA (YjgF/YER057c/UK114 family)
MIQRFIETHDAFTVYVTSLEQQTFVSISITSNDADAEETTVRIYARVAELLSESSSQIVHERCFASVGLHQTILSARARAMAGREFSSNTPVTFMEGLACSGNALAGFQIRAIRQHSDTCIRPIYDQGVHKGCAWDIDGSTFYLLQSVDGGITHGASGSTRAVQTDAMFRQAERILRSQGASYQDVVRTWIYISNILEWYDEFNTVRNLCYGDYGFFDNGTQHAHAEQLFLPASTGIEGKNPAGSHATMDVYAVHHGAASKTKVRPIYGTKQRSPFRYGSAFSRGVVIEGTESTLILVSGTASIDEEGKSIFIGNPAAQIRETLKVVSALIAPEGATLSSLCEATVFLKHQHDYAAYQKVIAELGFPELPAVNVVADVCRDELLFEIDAAFILPRK